MTDLAASPPARDVGHQPSGRAVTWRLLRLALAYPAFRFSCELFGDRGTRWVAERNDSKAPGLRVVITDSLMELRFALRIDETSHAW